MAEPKSFTLGGVQLPLDIEALESLHLAHNGTMHFDFTFRDIRFAARYEEAQPDGHLKLVGDLGGLPFSAESPAARAGIGQIVVAANTNLGPLFRLTQEGRLLFGGDLPVAHPVTATQVVSAVARFLIPATPYLELLSVYIAPPLEPRKPGESAVRPEWRKKRR